MTGHAGPGEASSEHLVQTISMKAFSIFGPRFLLPGSTYGYNMEHLQEDGLRSEVSLTHTYKH